MSNLEIIVSESCPSCRRVVTDARLLTKQNPNVKLQIIDISESRRKLSIVPAVFLDEQLICYGTFNSTSILSIIQKKHS